MPTTLAPAAPALPRALPLPPVPTPPALSPALSPALPVRAASLAPRTVLAPLAALLDVAAHDGLDAALALVAVQMPALRPLERQVRQAALLTSARPEARALAVAFGWRPVRPSRTPSVIESVVSYAVGSAGADPSDPEAGDVLVDRMGSTGETWCHACRSTRCDHARAVDAHRMAESLTARDA